LDSSAKEDGFFVFQIINYFILDEFGIDILTSHQDYLFLDISCTFWRAKVYAAFVTADKPL
jgi:hypothetical protein